MRACEHSTHRARITPLIGGRFLRLALLLVPLLVGPPTKSSGAESIASSNIGVGNSPPAGQVRPVELRQSMTRSATPVVHRAFRAQPSGAAPDAPPHPLGANPSGPSPSLSAPPTASPPDPFAVPMKGEIKLTPVRRLSTNIAPSQGELPRNHAAETFQGEPHALNGPDGLRVGAPFYSTPRAAGFVHRPLYFEERAVERHGRSLGPLQPAASGLQFFATLPVLPYKMGARSQYDYISTGNGVRPKSDRLTLREHLRGAVAEAVTATGAAFVIP